MIENDYNMFPIKPCMDGEPRYEDHPTENNTAYHDDYDVREAAYWALFAGAHGHTYGCHDIWQFYNPQKFSPINSSRKEWKEALQLPGAKQMKFVKSLMESFPFLVRIPDQSIIASEIGERQTHIQATRDFYGSYAFIYLPKFKNKVLINMNKITGEKKQAWWFNPREGKSHLVGEFKNKNIEEFTSPSRKNYDWILIINDISKSYIPPGTGK